jgi:Holliday junction resolvasome RuvABC ATP-dependent DNA helicase subunit
MAIERIVNTQENEDEQIDELLELSLRPKTFAEYIGQERIKTNL